MILFYHFSQRCTLNTYMPLWMVIGAPLLIPFSRAAMIEDRLALLHEQGPENLIQKVGCYDNVRHINVMSWQLLCC